VNVFVNVGSLGALFSKCVDFAIFLKDVVASVSQNVKLNTGDGIFYPKLGWRALTCILSGLAS
jgi:hypothetical protein